jgi:hypothetical protein
MGLLDTIDPGILALLGGPTQDDAAAIRKRELLTAGLAMMQHANLKPMQAIGYGGQVGLQAGADMQNQMAQQRAQRLGGFSQAMGLQNQLQQFQDEQATRQALQGYYGNQGMPGAAPQSAAPPTVAPQSAPPPPQQVAPRPSGPWQPGMPLPPDAPPGWAIKTTADGIPYMGPPSVGTQVASNAPVQIPSASPVPAKTTKYEQYQQIGDMLAQKGLVKQAQQYYDQAEKFRPKPVGEPKEVTMGGQRVMVQNYDSGPPQVMPYDPAQDKPVIRDGRRFAGVQPANARRCRCPNSQDRVA